MRSPGGRTADEPPRRGLYPGVQSHFQDRPNLGGTRSIHTAITLLVALLQLVPPGACVCQFGLRPATAPTRQVAKQPLATRPHPARACSGACCRESVPAANTGRGDRMAVRVAPADHGRPIDDRSHAPGCPALDPQADHAKVTEQKAPATATPAPAVPAGVVEPDTARPVVGLVPLFKPGTSPPVYITFRTLLI